MCVNASMNGSSFVLGSLSNRRPSHDSSGWPPPPLVALRYTTRSNHPTARDARERSNASWAKWKVSG
jgi:hypothetical protein